MSYLFFNLFTSGDNQSSAQLSAVPSTSEFSIDEDSHASSLISAENLLSKTTTSKAVPETETPTLISVGEPMEDGCTNTLVPQIGEYLKGSTQLNMKYVKGSTRLNMKYLKGSPRLNMKYLKGSTRLNMNT